MTLSTSDLRKLLEQLDAGPADAIESETLECKTWDQASAAQEPQIRMLRENVVCLANARGGVILLGVADRKRTRREAIQGVGDLDQRVLRRKVYDGTEPHILVEIDEILEPEGRILAVRVPRGLPPHTTSEGVAKIRIGKECKPLTGPDLARLVASGGQIDPTAQTLPGSGLSDLDPEVLKLVRRYVATDGQKPELAELRDEELLANLGLRVSGELTLAAVLLAGTSTAIARWAPSHEVVFLNLRRGPEYDARHDLRGPVLAALESLQRFFEAHLRLTQVQTDLFAEVQVPDLTGWAAREAVLNALVHRDYFLRQSVYIEVHPGKIHISSPGGFIGGVTPENVLRHPPVRRNPLLANACQALGLVNRAGLGVDRLYLDLLRLGKGMPRYQADEASVRLILLTRTHEGFVRFVTRERREGRELGLDDLILLRCLAERGEIDRWSAARALQLDEDEAADKLVSLRERGYLQPRGRGRGTCYRLSRALSDELRGVTATDDDVQFDAEAVRLRVLAVLRERGELSNADVRRISGFSRPEVVRLMRRLREDGVIVLEGAGRAARYRPANPAVGGRGRRRRNETGE
ncbi:MAG TPA: RNA-binding domain-containing protein [Thermoanaerobaculia bacterium]